MVLYIGDFHKAKRSPQRVFTYEKKETNENKYVALIYKTTREEKKAGDDLL